MGDFLRRITNALGVATDYPQGTVLAPATRQSLIRDEHQFTRCTYSTKYRAWVRTCTVCGQVVAC